MSEEVKRVIGRPFQKGNKMGKGRQKTSEEVKYVSKLTREEIVRTMSGLIHLKLPELEVLLKDKDKTVHELMLARVLVEAIKKGDNQRIEWFYQRTVGKMREQLDVSVTHNLHDQFIDYLSARNQIEAPQERRVNPESEEQ